MTRDEIDEAARWLVTARLEGRPAGGYPRAEDLAEEEAGYAVQAARHRMLGEEGFGRLVGYKVGCTNQAVQEALGMPGPAYGGIVAANLYWDEVELERAALQTPGIE